MGRVEHATPPISSHGWHWVASVANVRVAVSTHVQVFRGSFFFLFELCGVYREEQNFWAV